MDVFVISLMQYLAARSWQIMVVTVAVATIAHAPRNRSAHVRYLLWLVVVATCLVPPLHVISFRILAPRPPGAVVSAPASPRQEIALPALRGASDSSRSASAGSSRVSETRGSWLPAYKCFGGLWVAGAAVHLLVNALRACRGYRRLREDRRPVPPNELRNMAILLQPYGAPQLPPIWELDDAGQPFVWGLLRGSVYVPAGFHTIENPTHKRDILAHEVSHVIRYDAAVNTLQVVAQALFWFHPLVWWVNRRICHEREKCCDEMVLARLHTTPRDYCLAIVETLARTRQSTQAAPAMAVAGPLRHIQERIRTMLRPGKRFYKRPGVIAITLVILATLLVTPTAVLLTSRPMQIVSGTVRVAPTTIGLLDQQSTPFDKTSYEVFMHTQTLLITTDTHLLQKVVDDLMPRNLAFFSSPTPSASGDEEPQLPDDILRQAIADGVITVAWLRDTELLEVSMATENIQEAKVIVNSFLRNYVGAYAVDETTCMSRDIMVLEMQRTEIRKRIAERRSHIRAEPNDSGTSHEIELRLDEELYEKIARRLQEMAMQQQRPSRVQVAALAELKGSADNRMQWPLIILGAVIVLSGILLLLLLALRPSRRAVEITDVAVATPIDNS